MFLTRYFYSQRQAIEDLAKASKQDSVDLKLEDGAMLKLKSLKIGVYLL